MGFFSELKEDLSQAVNELIPEEEKAELTAQETAEPVAQEAAGTDKAVQEAAAPSGEEAEDVRTETYGQTEQMHAAADNGMPEISDGEAVPRETAAQESAIHTETGTAGTVPTETVSAESQEKKDMEQLTAWLNELDEKDGEKEVPAEKTYTEETKKENKEGRGKMDNQTREAVDETSVITAGMTITGDIASEGSVDVIGTVNGNINILGKLNITGTVTGNSTASEIFADNAQINGEVVSEGAVKVGPSSVIIGNITAKSAVIAGAVKGDIDVQGPVVLDTSAIVMGNIKSKAVQINNGAVIEGMCSQCYADVNPSSFFEDYKTKKNK